MTEMAEEEGVSFIAIAWGLDRLHLSTERRQGTATLDFKTWLLASRIQPLRERHE